MVWSYVNTDKINESFLKISPLQVHTVFHSFFGLVTTVLPFCEIIKLLRNIWFPATLSVVFNNDGPPWVGVNINKNVPEFIFTSFRVL